MKILDSIRHHAAQWREDRREMAAQKAHDREMRRRARLQERMNAARQRALQAQWMMSQPRMQQGRFHMNSPFHIIAPYGSLRRRFLPVALAIYAWPILPGWLNIARQGTHRETIDVLKVEKAPPGKSAVQDYYLHTFADNWADKMMFATTYTTAGLKSADVAKVSKPGRYHVIVSGADVQLWPPGHARTIVAVEAFQKAAQTQKKAPQQQQPQQTPAPAP